MRSIFAQKHLPCQGNDQGRLSPFDVDEEDFKVPGEHRASQDQDE